MKKFLFFGVVFGAYFLIKKRANAQAVPGGSSQTFSSTGPSSSSTTISPAAIFSSMPDPFQGSIGSAGPSATITRVPLTPAQQYVAATSAREAAMAAAHH